VTPSGRNPIPRALDAVAVLAILCGLISSLAALWDLTRGGDIAGRVVACVGVVLLIVGAALAVIAVEAGRE
jgi:hypothetical protein